MSGCETSRPSLSAAIGRKASQALVFCSEEELKVQRHGVPRCMLGCSIGVTSTRIFDSSRQVLKPLAALHAPDGQG